MVKMLALPNLSGLKSSLFNARSIILCYVVRIILIVHILATSYWPDNYINLFRHLATRVILAVLVVGLLFWDLVSGALLAILLVLTVQESKSRQMGIIPANNVGPIVSKLANNNNTNVVDTGLIPHSVYGKLQVPPVVAGDEKVGAYMSQIGELGISSQIKAGQGVQLIDGVPSVKVNMDQLATNNNLMDEPNVQTTNPGLTTTTLCGKEGYQMPTLSVVPRATVNLGTEYDHPANKTMTENLKIEATGFITDKNLLDAQINSITGLDGSQPPCFVASQSGIWNAQGFGSIARAVDNEDCPHSFI